MKNNEQKNLLLAIFLSALILGGFEILFKPNIVAQQRQQIERTQAHKQLEQAKAQAVEQRKIIAREEALRGERVVIENPRVKGSINLTGGRIDDLILLDYRETIDPASPQIVLLSPESTRDGYYAEFGWVGGAGLPNANTVWKADGKILTPQKPVTLRWDNGAGVTFEKTFSIDADYLITVTQKTVNHGAAKISVNPYAAIARYYAANPHSFFVLHEGMIGVLDGVLQEKRYNDMHNEKTAETDSTGGWLGITDKYWLAAVIPDQSQPVKARFAYTKPQQSDRYQADYTMQAVDIAPGASSSVTSHFFAGAKEIILLDKYEDQLSVPRFDRAVDFGWYYFLTKPLFYLLHILHNFFGNFGLAILALTVLVKGLMFPVANKSYRTMNMMKKLQPELIALRDKHREDPLQMQKEMAAFYRQHRVNPLSGCLTIFIQIPVFFSLYKVLFVSIEMRHQPFYGWIKDLSAPDPTTVFNLFGLIDWTPPSHFLFVPLMVGAWPLIMGFTMWLQQKLNPAPMDPAQKIVLGLFPYLFTFLLASFPAGLVIYWSWSNILGIAQQYALRVNESKA